EELRGQITQLLVVRGELLADGVLTTRPRDVRDGVLLERFRRILQRLRGLLVRIRRTEQSPNRARDAADHRADRTARREAEGGALDATADEAVRVRARL